MTHCLPRSILRDHLRRVRRALARAFKANFSCTRPANDVSIHVGDRHDRVVKSRENVRDASVNIFAAFGFDDFGFSISSAESERFSGGGAADVASTFLVLAGFFAGLATASALAGVDSETASAGANAPTAGSGTACATSPFEAFVGFFAFDVSALDLVVFFNSAI